MIDHDYETVCAITAEIRPMLARQPDWIQGPVLATLLGRFLADYTVEHDYAATEMMRIAILTALIDTVHDLVVAHDKDRVAGHA